MKKTTIMLFASFIASIGLVNAQDFRSVSETSNISSNPQRYVQPPAAYYNNSSRQAVGEDLNPIDVNLFRMNDANLRIPYTGTYYAPTANATNALIFDNGPHFNMPGTPNVSLLESATLSMNTLGAGVQKTADNSIADDFTLAEEFDIATIDVYTYQTGATPPSITAIYMQIWSGDPSAGGTVIWGDLTTNVMSTTVFENAYRASETSPTDTSRAIQKVTADTDGLTLGAGTYWVEYTFEGTGASGPWAPPIAILGQTTTGNAMQNLGGTTWAAWEDTGTFTPQGLPFQIYGTATGGGGTGTSCDVSHAGNNFEDARPCGANTTIIGANDIIVPADTNMTLNKIMPNIWMDPGTTATSVLVNIYEDNSGLPGTLLDTQTVVPTAQNLVGNNYGLDIYEVEMDLAPVSLPGNEGAETTYWIGIMITTSSNTSVYWEFSTVSSIGNPLAISQNGDAFYIPDPSHDGVYTFYADCEPMSVLPFPNPYCGPLDYTSVEPISNVEIAGIANRSDATIGGSPAHEDFTSISGDMTQGETYEITLEGNTDGNFTNRFVVFIDWNQNGVLDDAGEVYEIAQPLENSNGNDGIYITGDIVVPANAILGDTRMRVKKNFNTARLDPCVAGGAFGQAEDYTINVSEALGVSDMDIMGGFSFYPNPTSDIINLSSYKNIDSVALYNLLGQQVFTSKIGANTSDIDISNLSTGTYVMKVSVDGQIGTYKLIKQ